MEKARYLVECERPEPGRPGRIGVPGPAELGTDDGCGYAVVACASGVALVEVRASEGVLAALAADGAGVPVEDASGRPCADAARAREWLAGRLDGDRDADHVVTAEAIATREGLRAVLCAVLGADSRQMVETGVG